jgi:hypothetical protein
VRFRGYASSPHFKSLERFYPVAEIILIRNPKPVRGRDHGDVIELTAAQSNPYLARPEDLVILEDGEAEDIGDGQSDAPVTDTPGKSRFSKPAKK